MKYELTKNTKDYFGNTEVYGTQEPYWDEMKRKLREEAEIDISEEIKKAEDNVNHPAHYGNGSIECIDYLEDFLTEEEFIGYLRGNIGKYLHRWRYKNGLEDLRKAEWYLKKLIGVVEHD